MNVPCDEVLVPELYCLFFHNNVCHVCKKTENLLRCSRCKTVAYCSKNHQKLDWKIHKGICSALASASSDIGAKVNNYEDILTIKKLRYLHIREKLGRELSDYEMQMWMFPRFCEVCFSEKVPLDCEKCRNVFFCSENHRDEFQKQHEKHCDELKLQMETLLTTKSPDENFVVSEISRHITNLPDTLVQLLQLYDESAAHNADIMHNFTKLMCISPVASLLYSLEKCGFVNNRIYHKSELIVHIVGADVTEMRLQWKQMSELVFHWLNNITILEYFIIGPELTPASTESSKDLCDACRSRSLKSRHHFHKQLYHNIVDQLKKPDVVVAFNSGIHKNSIKTQIFPGDYDPEHMWGESIKYLMRHKDVPLILTAYTHEELVRDVEEVKKHIINGIKVLVEPMRNPFSDMRPIRDFESNIEPVYYVNGFIAVLTSCPKY